MTQPYSYNTYVKSQIGGQYDIDNHERSHMRSTVQRHDAPFYQGSNKSIQTPSKEKLRNKFNELLNLCKNENIDVNSDLHTVMGDQKKILDLLKGEFSRQPPAYPYPNTTSQYVRSNVQNFPPSQTNIGGHEPHFNPDLSEQKTAILKSKIQDLLEENRQLKYYASSVERPEDDPEIMELQREISRLRALIPHYEAEIAKLNRSPSGKAKLIDLLDQGERIRQQTIAMLRSGGSGSGPGEYSQLTQQLESLRARCRQLENENIDLKRMSKGTEQTGHSRAFY